MALSQGIFIFALLMSINLWYGSGRDNIFTTQMQVNGLKYDAVWDCAQEVSQQIEINQQIRCTPTKLRIRKDKEGRGNNNADLNTIKELIGKPSEITYVDPSTASFRCIDGRTRSSSLYTMGGDAGEFMLGLIIYEELKGSDLTQAQVDNIFNAYLETMQHPEFYWCTDDKAVKHIEDTIEEYGIDINNPREDLQDQILNIITDPNNIGDTHFKTLLNEADKLAIRKELVELFIVSYYKNLWNSDNSKHNITLEQLVGEHEEQTFIDIRNDRDWNAPLIRSRNKQMGVSVYFNHQEAAKDRRDQMANFFTNQINHNGNKYNQKVIQHRFDNHALTFLEVSGSKMAGSLPFYTVLFV